MIFRPELLEKILAGEKTETRRPCKDGRLCPYKPGRTYALQPGRGKPADPRARIRILSAFRGRLGQITDVDARAEGFIDRDQFLGYWSELHGEVSLGQPVYVIRFALLRNQATEEDT